MTKSIEDYPELKDWYSKYIVETLDLLSEFHFGFQPDEVEEKLLEMQATIIAQQERISELEKYNYGLAQESHQKSERISELESQVEFKVNECITLAKACQRWKESALNKESK